MTRRMTENGVEPTKERVERAYAAQFLGDSAAYDRAVGARVDPANFRVGVWCVREATISVELGRAAR